MNNNDIAIENFILYCDDMMIAEESVFTSIKNGLIKLFTRLVIFLDKQVKNMKDSRLKKILQSLLERAKRGLNISKSMKEGDEEITQELRQESEEIQREADIISKSMDMNDITYREDGKTILFIVEPNGKETWFYEDGKTIEFIEEPNGKEISYREDGKTIRYIVEPNGKETYYRKDGTIDRIIEPNGKETYYRKDGKTIRYIVEPNGKETWFDEDGKRM